MSELYEPLVTAAMKTAPLATLTAFAAVVGGLLPSLCDATPLESQLDCKSSAHRFIAPLVANKSIDARPMRVEANSVNAFKPTQGSELTAYGFRVYAVLGYEQGDDMFKRGSGQPINDSAYGVVVLAAAETVEAKVRESGSTAVVKQVVPMLMTAVFCDGSGVHNTTTAGPVTTEASRNR
ncbi:hypothetical protein AWB73_00543 [Caballeronia turbans]|jgi:hypothetical protein|nr:hypothetical protein AWB73_00543 [Caballeronia turbans]